MNFSGLFNPIGSNIEKLIETLRSNDWKKQRDAAIKLGNLRDARAVEPWIAALKNRESSVVKTAAEALSKINAS
jgi:HEAT repeat protein